MLYLRIDNTVFGASGADSTSIADTVAGHEGGTDECIRMMKELGQQAKRKILITLVFLTIVITHVLTPLNIPTDTIWVLPTALALIHNGSAELSCYQATDQDYRIELVEGKPYSRYPVAVSFLAMPFVYVIDKFESDPSWVVNPRHNFVLMKMIASLIVALTAVCIYLVAEMYLPVLWSVFVVFVFGYCTASWSTASRAMYQHGPSMLMLTVSLYLVLRAQYRPKLIQFCGVPLALAFLMRPTNGISCAVFTVYVLIHHSRSFVRFIAWTLPIAIPFLAYNLCVYGAILPSYFLPARVLSLDDHLLVALLGNLISPARGIFVFSPILLFSVAGGLRSLWDQRRQSIDYYVVAIIILHWVTISSHPQWWGGWAIGPRLFSDMIPYFLFFLIAFLENFRSWALRPKALAVAAMVLLCSVSFWINYRGATDPFVWWWNGIPTNIDHSSERVWDCRDLQFLRGWE